MIINTGNRTDIPAFYSAWFWNRLKEGSVCVRNPYRPTQVTRYRLSPEVVDCILFCTKNPGPMLPDLQRLQDYGQLWFVTLTPYGNDIEPGVPPVAQILGGIRQLSQSVGPHRVVWRYDPIIVDDRRSRTFHINAFTQMAAKLEGAVQVCVISFVDLYAKSRRNFPVLQEVSPEDRWAIAGQFATIGARHGIRIQTCAEGDSYAKLGVDTGGCMSQAVIENAIGAPMVIPASTKVRPQCDCVLGHDIGAYHSCLNGCLYCYATANHAIAKKNAHKHDPDSPLMIGRLMPGDTVKDAVMVSYIQRHQQLFPDNV